MTGYCKYCCKTHLILSILFFLSVGWLSQGLPDGTKTSLFNYIIFSMARIWKSCITIITIHSLIPWLNLLQSSESIYPVNSWSIITNFCATFCKFQSLTASVQVVWLKVELCRLLEEKRSAILRLLFFGVHILILNLVRQLHFLQPATYK